MGDKLTEIQKPWAVYGWYTGSWDIGKVTSESENSLYIQYCEGQHYLPECWDFKWVKVFDDPLKAIAYFLVHKNKLEEGSNNKEKVVKTFLRNFPNERKNIEKRLARV
jgi:hypothetical protein